MKSLHYTYRNRGFTLLEILLVVAAISILAGIVIFAVNPGEILAKMRNGQRRADVNKIINAVYSYTIDNSGSLPGSIPPEAGISCGDHNDLEICESSGGSCSVNLSNLTTDGKYLVEIPSDPQGYVQDTDGVGYYIMRNTTSGRITVCAPKAELGETIEVVK